MLLSVLSSFGVVSVIFAIILMLLCFGYVFIFPFCIAVVADKQGRSGFGWFVLSLFLTPPFTILVLIALGDTDAKWQQRIMEDERVRDSVRSRLNPPPQKVNEEPTKAPDHSRYMPH